MVNKVDHIGIAVKSIKEAIPFYEQTLGLSLMGEETVETQKVKVAFLQAGETKIELLEPLSSDSPIQKYLDKKGEGVHHIAFGVTSIEERITQLKTEGIRMIDEQPRKGAAGANIAFIHPASTKGILYELCEKQTKGD
ncbi:methylmalonyl-CoA epimerase [Metabacillus iocasae]|uniref:Methylmalonyl-CoA/ethylmalonyl-CoA epimerase n=1 Tax=Priestia iocasae TaxID=2291674 RepID=A0ABS2QRE6_9BACI|nr:methylmalonyl-CoA epimerase [Metabacillus iocasae]MBM7701617.1 methylmalonyl-CoA/ethylmalonyl-CoA epimerase [Metabacillus iocasae]